MKKIIFCDIDGTIIDGSRGMIKISEKTRYAFEELKKDNYVFIASGRCKGLLNKQVLDLKPSGYILCNGAYGEFQGKPVFCEKFDKKAVEKIKEVSKKYDGFYIFETLDEIFVDSLTSKAFQSFIHGWGMVLDGFSDEKVDKDFSISMIGFNDDSDVDKVEAELKDYADIARHNGFSSYDVNIKGINKGYGVKKILESLDIPKENAYCFGDGANDLEMLEEVGHPVIMANCDEKLKNHGFEKTDDVLDDGVYNYLVSHKLIKAL